MSRTIKIRWITGKDLYYPGEVTEVAQSFARFVVYHGYAELADNVCPECFSEVANESGCRTCHNCGWSKCS